MLKFTNSFCRYLKLTFKNIIYNRIYVKQFAHLSNIGRPCTEENIYFASPFVQSEQQLTLRANLKKRIRLKRLPLKYSDDSKKFKQMSDSLEPTSDHVSYGGQFDVSTDDDNPVEEWLKHHNEAGSANSTNKNDSSQIPPDFRVWEPVQKKNDSSDGNGFKFKILSYNVLAQYLLECHPYLYTDCSSRNLKWKIRAARLFEEIQKLAPDILCFQEVQVSHLSTFYSKFEQIGYFGIFKQKTGHRQDGCAIYFKQSLFELKDHISVEFYQPELPILNRDNIGLMVKLIPRNTMRGPPIVVATTHLLYNPKRTDVRLAQIRVFLAEIDRFAYCNSSPKSGHLPVILTGDFNSTPDSPVIKLLDRGTIRAHMFRDSSDWTRIGVTDNCQHLSVYLNRYQGFDLNMTQIYNSDYSTSTTQPYCNMQLNETECSELFNSNVIGHPLKLTSVYNKYKPDGHYEATTFQDYWVTVDYIYFSYCSSLRLVERLRLPTAMECNVLGNLPNDIYGSDHLALAAVFELKPCKSSL